MIWIFCVGAMWVLWGRLPGRVEVVVIAGAVCLLTAACALAKHHLKRKRRLRVNLRDSALW